MKPNPAWILVAFVIAGCKTGHIPNPNEPSDVKNISPEILRRNLQSVTESLGFRMAHREINRYEYRAYVAKAAAELMLGMDSTTVAPDQAWKYGEVLKDARRWKEAEPVLRIAVANAFDKKDDDRFINDSLRLATVLAEEGNVLEAITTAKSVFGKPANELAPVLFATYLEIVPAARGKNHDYELAKLVEGAIECHKRTVVDPKSDAGRTFNATRSVHVSRAWDVAASLYEASGHHDLALKAIANVDPADSQHSGLTSL